MALPVFFDSEEFFSGVTATNIGFYGPQGRQLRLKTEDAQLNDKLENFDFKGTRITNLEMETSGIYGLCKLLGHRALSINAILANRATGVFSKDPAATVNHMITTALARIASL